MSIFNRGADLRAYQNEWRHNKVSGVRGMHGPAADPLLASPAVNRALSEGAKLRFGIVVDAVAYVQAYRVFFEAGTPPIPCTLLTSTSLSPIGASAITTLVPWTRVWCLVHPELDYGLIIGVDPKPIIDPTTSRSDVIHGANRSGLRVDAAHNAILRLDNGGGASDWSAGRPFDATTAGEWGAQTETGMRITLDSFLAQLGASEACGVFAFYHDELLRMMGVNLQEFTAGSERELLFDEGEIAGYKGVTPYPWEQTGALAPGLTAFKPIDPQASQIDTPYYGSLEPENDDQQAFHRVVTLDGYLGQGGRSMVLLPPNGGGLFRYSTEASVPCVAADTTSLTGRRVIESAQGNWLIKRIAIPGPKRARRPEDAKGDSETNYLFAGLPGAGHGPSHEVSAGPTSKDPDPHIQTVAAVLDTVAFMCNWEGIHPLHYHKQDWALPDEADTDVGTNQTPIGFGELAGSQFLSPPNPIPQNVDHRYGDVNYYPNISYFGQLPDGGVVIGDGYGSEIRMSGGDITISCPGNIWFKAGKNVIQLAGRDLIMRAKQSADISCTNGDLRLKAENNLQVLANKGGVLIESKAEAPSFTYANVVGENVVSGGIQLKSAHGGLTAWASSVYLRTGGGDVDNGPIVLDASRGADSILTYSDDFVRFLGDSAFDYFGTEGNIIGANTFNGSSAKFAGTLDTGGTLTVATGGITVSGMISVADGHIQTSLAAENNGLVADLNEGDLDTVNGALNTSNNNNQDATQTGAESWQQDFAGTGGPNETAWYAPGQPGDDDTISAVGFSFRDDAQYLTEGFRIFEDRWQQLARAGGGAPATWTETPIRAGSTNTYPFPGLNAWFEEETLLEQDLVLFDLENGVSVTRDPAVYGKPVLKAPTPKKADGNYAVIL